MRRKPSPCSIAFARLRRRSWALAPVLTSDPRWPAHARVSENVSAGEEKSYEKSAERYPRSKIVCTVVPELSSPIPHMLLAAGLTDYEVRDLNDEINKLLREKRHWENQIIALGGANYRRNVAMLDDDGKEVPGTKGYKYAHS